MTGVLDYTTVFGLRSGATVTQVAIGAVRASYAIVPVQPLGKRPLCTLTARDRKAADANGKHACGVHHAITDEKIARRVFARLEKEYGTDLQLNIGIVAWPSRLVVIDADTTEEVEAFKRWLFEVTGDDFWLAINPNTDTPGSLVEGNWVHKGGGHFYYRVPEGVDLPEKPGEWVGPGGFVIHWGWSQTLAGGSVRAEGTYTCRSEILDAPTALVDTILARCNRSYENRVIREAMYADEPIGRWSMAVSWAELLEPDGWTATGKPDRCGCPIFTRPGEASHWKSATAHESDCDQWDNIEGHGPLHIWSDTAAASFPSRTITKLNYVAHVHHDGDVEAAKAALGIALDLDAWLGSSDLLTDLTSVTSGSSGTSGPSPNGQSDDLTTPYKDKNVRTSEPDVTSTNTEASDHGPDVTDVRNPEASDESSNPHRHALDAALRAKGIPLDSLAAKSVRARYQKSVEDDVVKDARRRFDAAAAAGPVSSWLPGPNYVEEFVNGVTEPGPTVLTRTDAVALFYPGRVNGIVGRKGCGKTWLAMRACADVLASDGKILYYDMEDNRPAWRDRMLTLGCADIDQAATDLRAIWVKPGDLPDDDEIETVVEYAGAFDLVVFDVMNRLISRAGGNVDSGNQEILRIYDTFLDPVARLGPAVVVLDHPNKRGQHTDATIADLSPGGGATKMNNASGHVIGMMPKRPFTRDNPNGHVRLVCLKDRAGHFEEHQGVGEFIGQSADTGGMTLRVDPPAPEEAIEDHPTDIVDKYANKVLDLLRKNGPMSEGFLNERVTPAWRPARKDAFIRLSQQGLAVRLDGGIWSLPPEKKPTSDV